MLRTSVPNNTDQENPGDPPAGREIFSHIDETILSTTV